MPKPKQSPSEEPAKKNPAAVALGRLGGLKGGHARAKALSKDELHEIAMKGVRARQKKRKQQKAEQAE